MRRSKFIALIIGAIAMLATSLLFAEGPQKRNPQMMRAKSMKMKQMKQMKQMPKPVKIARAMLKNQKYDQALKIADKLMAVQPKQDMKNRRSMKKIRTLKMSGYMIAIATYVKMGNQGQAVSIAQQAIPVAKEMKARKAVKKLSRFVKNPDQTIQRRQAMRQKKTERRQNRQAR